MSELLTSPPHSLRDQAKFPRELPPGIIGSDGFGVGWFAVGHSGPARYRSTLPIWVDENVDTMTEQVCSSVIVASSRTASRRMPVAVANTPPFRAGNALLVHNGEITHFQDAVLDRLRSELSAPARANIVGNTDTEYIAALLGDRPEPRLVDGVRAVLDTVRACIEAARTSAQLNLIVARSDELVIARHAIGDPAPSLYVRLAARGVTAASEPMDAAAKWTSLAPGDVLDVTGTWGNYSAAWSRLDER